MSGNMINLNINEDMVKPILEKQIQAAIISNLGKTEELIGFAVTKALSMKVNKDGVVSNYGSDNRYDFLEAITAKAVREAATEAIKEYIHENKENLKIALKKEMDKKANQNKLVQAFVDSATNSFNYEWRFDAKVELKREER